MQDLAFWHNALTGIPTKRALWAETITATVAGNSTDDLLTEIHLSMAKLKSSLTTLGLEPLLENNNVGVLYKLCCTKLWATAVDSGCPPSRVDRWLKVLPARPHELFFFSDQAVREGCLLIDEGS